MERSKINNPGILNIKNRLTFLLKDSAIYGGSAAISKAFALITFPLLARHFSLEEYGVLDYFISLGSFLVTLFIFGQDSAVARYFYEYEETESRRQLITQSLIFQLLCLLLFIPLFWLAADWLTGFMISGPHKVYLFKIVLLQLPFLLVINFSQNILKWTFARTHFLFISLGYTIVQASLLVAALLFFDMGVIGVLVLTFLTSAVFSIFALFFIRKWLVRPLGYSLLCEMLPFAIPVGFICLAGSFFPILERTLTASILGAESLGLYAAGTKMAMLVGLLVNSFQTAWGPFSLSIHKQVDAGYTYNWVLKLFSLVICLAVLILTLITQPLISLLATDSYRGAIVVVFPLAMGSAIQAISWITEIGIGIAKRSHLNLYSYLVSIVFILLGIFLFTPVYGLLGVGLGVLLGQMAKAVVSSWLAQRAYPLPWHYGPVVRLITLTLVGGFTSIWIGNSFGIFWGNLIICGTVILIFMVGILFLFSETERSKLKASWKQFWAKQNFKKI